MGGGKDWREPGALVWGGLWVAGVQAGVLGARERIYYHIILGGGRG